MLPPLLLLLALPPLDLSTTTPAPAQADGLRIEARVDGRRVGARLVNVGGRPLDVAVHWSCAAATGFEVLVDGVARSFAAPAGECENGSGVGGVRLKVGGHKDVDSETVILDGEAHRVAVRYTIPRGPERRWQGKITSPPIEVGAAELGLELRLPDGARADRPTPMEIVHRWRGARPMWVLVGWKGVCASPQAHLLVDGAPLPYWPVTDCAGPQAPDVRKLAPGETFVAKGEVQLTAGRHLLHARYLFDEPRGRAQAAMIHVTAWTGSVTSAPIAVVVTP